MVSVIEVRQKCMLPRGGRPPSHIASRPSYIASRRGSFSGLALPEVVICGCLSVGIIAVGKGVLTFDLPEGGGNVEDGCRGAELS